MFKMASCRSTPAATKHGLAVKKTPPERPAPRGRKRLCHTKLKSRRLPVRWRSSWRSRGRVSGRWRSSGLGSERIAAPAERKDGMNTTGTDPTPSGDLRALPLDPGPCKATCWSRNSSPRTRVILLLPGMKASATIEEVSWGNPVSPPCPGGGNRNLPRRSADATPVMPVGGSSAARWSRESGRA